MNKYTLWHPAYTGAVQFNYDNAGLLVFYSVLDTNINEAFLVALLRKLPREEQSLAALTTGTQFVLKKLDEDLSFANFWEQYGQKIHAHRCEPFWNKMSDVKKLLALKNIAAYTAYCKRRDCYRVNPENYLKKEYYRTDFSKEI